MTSLFLCLCWTLQSNGAIQFSADYASFKEKDKLNFVEIYYAVPYNQFDYETINDTITAPYNVSIFIPEIGLRDSSRHRAIISSFQSAQERDLKIIEQFSFFALPGSYHLNLTLTQAHKSGSIATELSVRDLSGSPCLSDLELASEITADTTSGPFTKQGLRVVPNPGLAFGQAYNLLQVYLEIYSLSPDTGSYELSYWIVNDSFQTVKSFPSQIKHKFGSDLTEAFGISAGGLKPGSYYLQVEVTDRANSKKAMVAKKFLVSIEKPLAASTFTPDEQPYYRDIQLWADQPELRQFQNLNDAGKEKFLSRFWQQHDLKEFIKRVQYADDHFRFGRDQGRKTDRGRIYITYGAPSDIESYTMSEGYKPLESWLYYDHGYRFLFVDLSGAGNFRMIYTNHPQEHSDPNWQRYIDPTVREELQ
jgi:GWxTD domain-containing protein